MFVSKEGWNRKRDMFGYLLGLIQKTQWLNYSVFLNNKTNSSLHSNSTDQSIVILKSEIILQIFHV